MNSSIDGAELDGVPDTPILAIENLGRFRYHVLPAIGPWPCTINMRDGLEMNGEPCIGPENGSARWARGFLSGEAA